VFLYFQVDFFCYNQVEKEEIFYFNIYKILFEKEKWLTHATHAPIGGRRSRYSGDA
jgi:hypothetical protein